MSRLFFKPIARILKERRQLIEGRFQAAQHIDRASHTLATQMTEDDQKRIVVRFSNKA